jgi:hypothetical protein
LDLAADIEKRLKLHSSDLPYEPKVLLYKNGPLKRVEKQLWLATDCGLLV